MEDSLLSRWLLRVVALLERYLPDAFLFALIATVLVFGAGLASAGGQAAAAQAGQGRHAAQDRNQVPAQ
mgnify:CR=1 FL=1